MSIHKKLHFENLNLKQFLFNVWIIKKKRMFIFIPFVERDMKNYASKSSSALAISQISVLNLTVFIFEKIIFFCVLFLKVNAIS